MAETEKHKGTASTQAGDKYIVRFPDGMRERVAEAAKANNRSMNAEIVRRLEQSFRLPDVSGVITELSSDGSVTTRDFAQMVVSLQKMLRRASHLAETFAMFDAIAEAQQEDARESGTDEREYDTYFPSLDDGPDAQSGRSEPVLKTKAKRATGKRDP